MNVEMLVFVLLVIIALLSLVLLVWLSYGSYLKWSAANRRTGELLHLSEQDAGGVASVRAYGSYPCV